jgi:hypothetical protein
MVPSPLALALTLCDQVIVEEGTRKVSVIGSFRELHSRSCPFTPAPFSVLAVLTGTQGEEDLTLTVTALETDEEIYSFRRRIRLPDRFAEGRAAIRLVDCTFPAPGLYSFTLLVDGDWIAQRRLQVRQLETESCRFRMIVRRMGLTASPPTWKAT